MARVLRAVEAVRKVVALLRDAAAVAARRKVDSMVDMYFLFFMGVDGRRWSAGWVDAAALLTFMDTTVFRSIIMLFIGPVHVVVAYSS